jgi:chemotaxis signal transduction protein/nucleoid-associated protein YgaU
MRELLLASLGGRQYGIWKDAILSVRDIHALHRIPLSPSRIAGIMMEDGQTVTLGDLSVCIGYQPSAAIGQDCILLMADGEKVTGFVVNGELRTLSVSPGMLLPLPDYLKTTVFDTCAVDDGISIPVINVSELNSRVLKTGKEPSGFSPKIAAYQSRDIPGNEPIRFFTVAGELYAVPATGIDGMAVKPGPITPLLHTPRHVQGVTFLDGRLLTVIDLVQRIKHESAAPDSLMLMMRSADAAFGFLVDGDGVTLPADKVTIKPVPLIAQSSWLKHLATRKGELIPLVDLAAVLSPDSDGSSEKPIWQRYAADSNFPEIFFKHDVGVVEFSLLGERYALPKQEVEDVIIFKQPRSLPDVPSIVIGVAEHNGEILPVVDLAMMFGRRSLATPEWRMMLVNNGDFRALVITETVYSERRLSPEMHRTVPIHLPHNLMYGCYPDANAVRIILNVEAISVHFEKSLIQRFLPALSHEMRMSPTGVAYTFPEENVGQLEKTAPKEMVVEEQRPLEKETQARAEPEPVPEAAPSAGFAPAEPGVEQQAEREAGEFAEWEESDTGAAAITAEPAPIDIVGAAESSVDEWNAGAALEREHVEQVSEQFIAPETMTAAPESPEDIPLSKDFTYREPDGEGSKFRVSAERKRSPLEELKASAKKKRKQKTSATAAFDSRPSERKFVAAAAKSDQTGLAVEPLATWSSYEEHSAAQMWKRGIASGAIVAVLVAVFYFSATFVPVPSGNPTVEKSMPGTEPVKTEQAAVQPGQPVEKAAPVKTEADPAREQAEQDRAKAKAELEAKAQAETGANSKQVTKKTARQTLVLSPLAVEQDKPPHAANETRAPLELDIPENKPTDIDVYVVQEGDTLWSISEHFTGSPYNYPRIAGENRIADPDLIFPGQRIRLIK